MKKLTLFFIIFFSLTFNAFSAHIILTWDVDSDVESYSIYWGTESGVYTFNIENITSNSYTLTGLNIGTTYYIAIKAFNRYGNSSDFSDEVVYTPAGESQVRIKIGFGTHCKIGVGTPVKIQ
jgi:fibronectin type 3 domain-containing protein